MDICLPPVSTQTVRAHNHQQRNGNRIVISRHINCWREEGRHHAGARHLPKNLVFEQLTRKQTTAAEADNGTNPGINNITVVRDGEFFGIIPLPLFSRANIFTNTFAFAPRTPGRIFYVNFNNTKLYVQDSSSDWQQLCSGNTFPDCSAMAVSPDEKYIAIATIESAHPYQWCNLIIAFLVDDPTRTSCNVRVEQFRSIYVHDLLNQHPRNLVVTRIAFAADESSRLLFTTATMPRSDNAGPAYTWRWSERILCHVNWRSHFKLLFACRLPGIDRFEVSFTCLERLYRPLEYIREFYHHPNMCMRIILNNVTTLRHIALPISAQHEGMQGQEQQEEEEGSDDAPSICELMLIDGSVHRILMAKDAAKLRWTRANHPLFCALNPFYGTAVQRMFVFREQMRLKVADVLFDYACELMLSRFFNLSTH